MKLSLSTIVTAVIMQIIVGYFWYGPHLFGDVITGTGGKAIDFIKMDTLSLVLIVLGSYGLTYILDTLTKLTKTKDTKGSVKLGLTFGVFAIGLPVTMLLHLMGYGTMALVAVFLHLVTISILTNTLIVKLKKA
jgi:hypothetical protein